MANKKGLINNLVWKFAERMAAQMVTLIVSIVLARLLDPSHYGTVAIVTIFITLANVFVSDGFGSALIQKKDADELDFSSVLYFNIALSILLYLVLFFLAPIIAGFYGEGYEILTPVFRVLGLRLIPAAINSVQHAYVSKNMIFKKFFLSTLLGTIVSGIVGIWMAYSGFGVWALVAQYLVSTTVSTVVLMFSIGNIFVLDFSLSRLKTLFSFGWKILCTGLLITGYQELRALIIGKLYSSENLAYYDKGKQFPNLIVTNINVSIGAVLFPKLANQQDDIDALKQTTRNSIRFSSYIMSPMMLGLMAVADSFVSVVLTEKWLPCVPLLQLFCVFYLFQPIHTANTQAIKAMGRGNLVLKLELIRDVIQLAVLLVVMWVSVEAIVVSMATMSILFVFVNAYPNIKLMNYTIKEQLSDILPNVIMACAMFTCTYPLTYLPIHELSKLILQIFVGVGVYVLLSVITKNKEFHLITGMLFEKLKKLLYKNDKNTHDNINEGE